MTADEFVRAVPTRISGGGLERPPALPIRLGEVPIRWHSLWFDEPAQVGVGELTAGDRDVFHGAAVMLARGADVVSWRAFLRPGPSTLEEMVGRPALRNL
jgi:hypothetical protein